MKIAVACDHAGYPLKARILQELKKNGVEAIDLGTNSTEPVDYPDYAEALGMAVLDGRAESGILICGSGVGATVAANKLPGIRAGLCHDTFSAHQGREDDDVNVLCLGARVVGEELAAEIVRVWLRARFSGLERHVRRVGKIAALEEKYGMAERPVGTQRRSG
jgi:ribose 5-phosphate isomerase B